MQLTENVARLQRDMYEKRIAELKRLLKDAYIILSGNDLISDEFEMEFLEAVYDYSKLKLEQDDPTQKMLAKRELIKRKT